jgi:hypothetical protein
MFEQINKALLWLRNNNRINDYQLNVLQDYYKKNNNVNVDALRDELYKLGTDPSFVISKISEIENSNIDIIEFDDIDNDDFSVQEMNWIRGLHPDKSVNMTSKPHSYVLSGDGIEDIYVKVVGNQVLPDIDMYSSAEANSASNSQSESKGISLTKSTLVGRAMSDKENNQAAFTNVLFFIFLAGLSVGMVVMMVLNFFIK